MDADRREWHSAPGKYYCSNDVSSDPQMGPWRENALKRGYLAKAAFPFALGTKNAGVISLYAPVTGFFDEQIILLLGELAFDISFALKTIDEQDERKQADVALRDSKQELADIIDFLPDATFVINREGMVIAWNHAMEEMTGIRKEDMIGKGDHAYTIPFYGERRKQLLDLIDADDDELKAKYQVRYKKRQHSVCRILHSNDIWGKRCLYVGNGFPSFQSSRGANWCTGIYT